MRSRISVHVTAPPAVVFELARDVSAWPALLPHYRKVTIQSRDAGSVVASMHAVRQIIGRYGLPVSWRSRQWSDGSDPNDLKLHFRHLAGFTRGMEVTWHIQPTEGGSSVTIEHDFERRLPLLGTDVLPRFVDHVFVKPIASRTLWTFKRLAEASHNARN